jgi:hypothetical protein
MEACGSGRGRKRQQGCRSPKEGRKLSGKSICFFFALVLSCPSRFSTGARSAVFGPML